MDTQPGVKQLNFDGTPFYPENEITQELPVIEPEQLQPEQLTLMACQCDFNEKVRCTI